MKRYREEMGPAMWREFQVTMALTILGAKIECDDVTEWCVWTYPDRPPDGIQVVLTLETDLCTFVDSRGTTCGQPRNHPHHVCTHRSSDPDRDQVHAWMSFCHPPHPLRLT